MGSTLKTVRPLSPPYFAAEADNCIIDKKGRIASRKGFEYITTSGGTSSEIKQIFHFIEDDGTETYFSTGNDKVYSGTTTLTDETPGGASISADDWQFAQLNEEMFMFQSGHVPMMYDPDAGNVELVTAHTGYSGTVQQGNCVLAAAGRLWVGDIIGNKSTIYWSDLLNGAAWTGGSSGSLDLENHWPNGYDEIVALIEHNNFLVVFGKSSILLFTGIDTPSTMSLQDTIQNIGCVQRDAVVSIGSDIVFVDKSGLRSLGRTIQEKSAPIGSLSRNVNTDFTSLVEAESGNITLTYSRKLRAVICTLESSEKAYVFDTFRPLEDGSYRVTTWSNVTSNVTYVDKDGDLFLGNTDGIMEYSGDYTDEGEGYVMTFFAHPQDFGDNSIFKIPKDLDLITEDGGGYVVAVKYAYDYSEDYKTLSFTVGAISSPSEFGVAEFGEDEFSGSGGGITRKHVKMRGHGRTITIGLEVTIDGTVIAIQEFNIHAIIGRLH